MLYPSETSPHITLHLADWLLSGSVGHEDFVKHKVNTHTQGCGNKRTRAAKLFSYFLNFTAVLQPLCKQLKVRRSEVSGHRNKKIDIKDKDNIFYVW